MNRTIWLLIITIVIVTLGIAFLAPVDETFKGIATVSTVAALFTALFQLLQDKKASEEREKLQNEQHLFNLGATSHMANIVFDKHVEFCEKYLEEVHELANTLFREGPHQSVSTHAGKLYRLRLVYTAWVTPEMVGKLDSFESAVRKIAANAGFVNSTNIGSDVDEIARSAAITEMHKIFREIMGYEASSVADSDISVDTIVNDIRDILKISDLVHIRDILISKAITASVTLK